MTESQATTSLLRKLKDHGHFWKASDRFRAGIPDIIGCYLGRFVAIEMKIDYNKPSDIQVFTMKDIIKNTGYAAVVTYSNKDKTWNMGSVNTDLSGLVTHLLERMRHHEHDL
jgi:hypothetical protein